MGVTGPDESECDTHTLTHTHTRTVGEEKDAFLKRGNNKENGLE